MIIGIVGGVVGLVLISGVFVYCVQLYNKLISVDKKCEEAWSNIDVLLQQRGDELPKLIDTAKQYMEYEQETLQKVIDARSQAQTASSPQQQAEADSQLRGAMGEFFALAEDYPDLKANESFQQLQDRISAVEEQIADRRESYNQATTNYNTLIKQIPYVFVATNIGMDSRELYEAPESSTEDVDIGEVFNRGSTQTPNGGDE